MNKSIQSSLTQLNSFVTTVITYAIAFGLLLQSQGCATLSTSATPSVKSLAAHITAHIDQPRFVPAAWGIKIVSLDTGRTLFERNAQKYFIPASNTKLYTGALALETFQPNGQISTDLYATGPIIHNSVLAGDLVLYGQGDPTLGAAVSTGAFQQPFDYLAIQLAHTGLKRVQGDLIIDDSYFATSSIGTGWEANDLQWSYGAEVAALTLGENAFTLSIKPAANVGEPCEVISTAEPLSVVNRTTTTLPGYATGIGIYRQPGASTFYVFGSLATNGASQQIDLSLAEPAETIGNKLLAALAEHHIVIHGHIRIIHWLDHQVPVIPAQWHRLATITSPPLTDVLQQTFKRSQNLYAQDLLLQVGRHSSQIIEADACAKSGPPCTTERWGIYAMNAFLQRVGIPPGSVLLEEGSGLSRHNLVTPAATTALLQYMSRRPTAEVFQNALPIAGIDGTLESRMKGTAAENNVRAKTGSLEYVYTLAGYVTTAAKERLAFSIMLNNYSPPISDPNGPNHAPVPSPTSDLDAIVVMLAEFAGHS